MKSEILKIGALLGLVFVMFTACNNADDEPDIATIQDQIEKNVQSGTWKITYFMDSGVNETSNFSGFTFTFGANGVLTATSSSVSYTGTWSISDSNSNDDSQNDLDFNIYFNLTNDFEDLNDDWDIQSQTSSKIELIDVSGGKGGTDYLTFEKN